MDLATPPGFEERLVAKPYTVKTTDDLGSFEGLGAVFNDVHPTSSWALPGDWKDRIMPGAFMKTLDAQKRMGVMPAMLFMHERGNVVGAWREMGETGAGLHASGQCSLSAKTSSGAGIHELMKMGALNALSIGFRVRKAEADNDKKIRSILDVELNELSIVDIPGIPRARITDVKSGGAKSIRFLEMVLRDAGLSREEAKAVLAQGFGALRDVAAPDDGSSLREAGGDGETIDDAFVAGLKEFAAAVHP
jgi:hypothetical protein